MRGGSATYLLPVLLQRRHGREVARVVDELKFLKDAVVRQDIHADAPAESERDMEGGRGERRKGEKKKKKNNNRGGSGRMIHKKTRLSDFYIHLCHVGPCVAGLKAQCSGRTRSSSSPCTCAHNRCVKADWRWTDAPRVCVLPKQPVIGSQRRGRGSAKWRGVGVKGGGLSIKLPLLCLFAKWERCWWWLEAGVDGFSGGDWLRRHLDQLHMGSIGELFVEGI